MTLSSANKNLHVSFLNYYLFFQQEIVYSCGRGVAQKNIDIDAFNSLKIPLPPLAIQEKIVSDIEWLEDKEKTAKDKRITLKSNIEDILYSQDGTTKKLEDICEMKAGKFVSPYDISDVYEEYMYPCFGGNGLRGYTKTFTHEGVHPLIGRQGALCGNVSLATGKFHATEHAVVVKPKDNIYVKWLYYKLLNSNLNQYATGTAQPGLSVENLKNITIETPSFAEQQKIVAEIEVLESQINDLQAQLADIPLQKEQVLKKYL